MGDAANHQRGLFGKGLEHKGGTKKERAVGKVKDFLHDTVGFGKPTAKIVGFHLPSITVDQADVLVDILVSNPNPIPIPLLDITYLIESDGRKLVSGTIPNAGTIHSHGSESLKIPVALIYQNIKNTYHDIHPGEIIPYRIKIELIVDVPVLGKLTLPIEKTGEIPVPYKPEIDVVNVEFEHLSMENASAALHLKVQNKNKFDLGINALEYQFMLADTAVASATLSRSCHVQKCGVGAMEIPISFRPVDLGFAVWDIIKGRGAGYSMFGKLEVNTPFGPMHLPFSKEGGKTIFQKKVGI